MDMVAMMLLIGTVDVAWFPEAWTEGFYVTKGILGLISVLLLLFHMSQAWSHIVHHGTFGQQMRYYTLFAFSVLVTGASAEQLHDGSAVNYRNIGAFLITIMLIITMIISIRDDRHRQ